MAALRSASTSAMRAECGADFAWTVSKSAERGAGALSVVVVVVGAAEELIIGDGDDGVSGRSRRVRA